MSQTVVTVDVGGTGANNANAALTNLGALPTFGGSITGNLNVSNNIVVTGNANLNNFVISGNSISTTQNNGDVTLVPKGTGKLRVRSKGLFGNGAEAHFSSAGIDESSIAIGSVMDSNGAAEILAVNKNSGTLAYSEFIAINNSGDQDSGWISIGVNSSGYDDPEYTLTGPDDGYVLFEAPQGTSANGDLILGTGSYGLNNKIILAAGGFTPSDAQLIVAPADLKRANLVSYSVTANVVTFVTDITHTFVANDIVSIADVGAPYNGTRTITAVTSNTFNVSVTVGNIGSVNLSPPGFALQFLPFNKGTVELTAQLFVGENSRSIIETADITLAQGHAVSLGIVVDNDGPGQTVMFNKSNGTLSYSEFIAHNDASNVDMGWVSFGINSSGYDDPEFPITKADDAYLLYEPPANTTGDGDMIIGTGTNGQKNRLIFAAEGFDEANAQMIITPNESVRISIDTDASSSNTGALQVVGGVGVQGSMYVQGNQTIQGDLIVNGSQVIQSIENLAAAGPISLLSDGNIANTWDQGVVGTYAVSKTSNTQSISFKSIANNTATLTTTNNHIFLVEDYVTVANVDATFNGTHRITAVTSNTFSYFKLANNLTQTAATGTGTVDKSARYTGAVKRASDGVWRFFSNLGTRPGFNTNFADANLVYDSIIAGEGTFNGSLKLGSPNTATISYIDANNRTFTIPSVGGNRTFAFIDQAQTFTAAQGFNSTVTATKFIPTAGDATGNGLYLAGTNKLGLSADSVERVSIAAGETVVNDGSTDYDFRVESDGNANMLLVDGGLNRVGIGTGSPEQTLHVQGNTYISGNVGIGTTNPTSNLHVIGTANITSNLTLSGGTANSVAYLNSSKILTTGSALSFDGDVMTFGGTAPRLRGNMSGAQSTRFAIQNSTTDGNSRLYFYPNGTGTISAINLWNTSNVNAANYQSADFAIIGTTEIRISSANSGSSSYLPIVFWNGGGEKLRLDANGNVGINCAGTNARLEVVAASGEVFRADAANGAYRIVANQTGVNLNGNVGIGTTSPTSALHVESTFAGTIVKIKNNRGNASTDAGLEVETSTTAAKTLLIKNSTTDRFWVQGDGTTYINGNVGIGTTNPGSTLSVRGSTNLGDSHDSSTSALHSTRISGYALRYDASTRYGAYGKLLLHANEAWTSGARRYLITNGFGSNKFAIIRSTNALTDPDIASDAGGISSGTADFVMDNGG